MAGETSEQELAELLEALNSENSDIRWRAAGNAWKLKDARLLEPLVNILLNDPEWGPRCGAANSLGNLEDKRAIEPLIAALKDENPNVRQYVVIALGSVWDVQAIEPLITTLGDESRTVAQEIPDTLAQIGQAAVISLVNALKNPSPQIRYYTVLALGKIGGEQALQALNSVKETDKGEFSSIPLKEIATQAIARISQ